MQVKHVGLVCRTEKNADRFYGELLGLEKQARKTIPLSLVRPLFGLDSNLEAVNYVGRGLHFEIFLLDAPQQSDRLGHVCLEIDGLDELLERARCLGFAVRRVPKGDGWVTFVDDMDGHRFEIK
jgi:catechol 2,3-dioxygenase-like lactoylglutathione lyase family enzyme